MGGLILLLLACAILLFLVIQDKTKERPEQICTRCYQVGNPKEQVQGSFLIEVVLWLAFLIPGMIYSIWRLTSKRMVCPSCKSTELVPTDTPRGKALLQESNKLAQTIENTELVSVVNVEA